MSAFSIEELEAMREHGIASLTRRLAGECAVAVARAEAAESRLADVRAVVVSWRCDKRFEERRSWQGMARAIERAAAGGGTPAPSEREK